MILCDEDIEAIALSGAIFPYDPANLQPASYDVTLGNVFLAHHLYVGIRPVSVDPFNHQQLSLLMDRLEIKDDGKLTMAPGEFVLAGTREKVAVPENLVGRLEGRSSLGRLGLAIHITAGYIDPGFEGNITLECYNFSPRPLELTPGMRIAQLGFVELTKKPREPYRGRYQGNTEATSSKYALGEEKMDVYCSYCGKGPQRVCGSVFNGSFISMLHCEVCGKSKRVEISMED